MTPTLRTQGLSKSFGDFHANSDISLSFAPGARHALIGPNGAGKTTCFNLLTKFLQPTRGRITYKGSDITAQAPAEVARLGMVRSFQISAVFPHLTVLENVRIALQRQRGGSFDFWRSRRVLNRYNERALSLINDVGLTDFAGIAAVELPYGRKRAVELATTLAVGAHIELHLQRAAAALDLAERGLVAAASGVFPWTLSLLMLARARALRSLGRVAEARAAIVSARDTVLQIAASITSSELRDSFLINIDANARAIELANTWADETLI